MQYTDKKAIFGWSMYDWANSAFATTVMAGFFPIFFKQYWSADVDTVVSTARLGLANSLAGMTIAFSAPFLGAIADRGTSKKKFLLFFAYVGATATLLLFFISKGSWPMAIALYILATIGFLGGNIFYDALITDIASEKIFDFVSGLGFALGYLGGGILFAFNVWTTLNPEVLGFENPGEAMQFSFISVGIWWTVFSIPLFLFVKERKNKRTEPYLSLVKAGIIQLKETFRKIRHLKIIFLFLISYWLYIDGVNSIIYMAIDYGISIGLKSDDLIVALLITQFIGFPASLGFVYLGGKIGTRHAIFTAIAVYLCISFYGAFLSNEHEFFIMATLVGLVQGGIQALSRSYYARIIPVDKSAEYFGFYNLVGKFAAILGPMLIGGTGLLMKSLGYSSTIASRVSISSVSIFFIAGGILFYFVTEERGREEIKNLS
ncbi:MAG: MFS transporter [wastewater metagenome]|nr:MFS transporter [Candidatus Loosdrechtia aerotolerans]